MTTSFLISQATPTMPLHSSFERTVHALLTEKQSVDISHYISLLKACADTGKLAQAKLIHAFLIQRKIYKPHKLANHNLMKVYLSNSKIPEARRVFDQMTQQDACSWTLIISGYARHGNSQESLCLFGKLVRSPNCKPNSFTLSSLVSACANTKSLAEGLCAHEEITRMGIQCVYAMNALIDMYSKCGEIEKARNVFDKMPNPNVVSWTTMVCGYAQNKRVRDAMALFEAMPVHERDSHSWNVMIEGLMKNGRVEEGVRVFKSMPDDDKDAFSWTIMVSGYAQNVGKSKVECGVVTVYDALRVLEEVPVCLRSNAVWNAVISGFAQNGYHEMALKVFENMKHEGFHPDSKTFASVLNACAGLTYLEKGIRVHEEVVLSGFSNHSHVISALLDMYAKCGSIDKARELFDGMKAKDVVAWTSMITGYAIHGHASEAIRLFQEMRCSDVEPNHVTFLGVLSACCHAGLIHEGFHYFHLMTEEYTTRPLLEHYRCMVDMLCRGGLLSEAHEFIKKMPLVPDVSVWSCLLSACRLHDDLKLGECAAKQVIEMDPSSDAAYVLLSSIYGRAGRWTELERVRNMMKECNVKRIPGCSWIEVGNQVHGFLGGFSNVPENGICG